jgi:hypothetical protein
MLSNKALKILESNDFEIDMTGMQAHQLSSRLTTVYDQPFFDFINGWRVAT